MHYLLILTSCTKICCNTYLLSLSQLGCYLQVESIQCFVATVNCSNFLFLNSNNTAVAILFSIIIMHLNFSAIPKTETDSTKILLEFTEALNVRAFGQSGKFPTTSLNFVYILTTIWAILFFSFFKVNNFFLATASSENIAAHLSLSVLSCTEMSTLGMDVYKPCLILKSSASAASFKAVLTSISPSLKTKQVLFQRKYFTVSLLLNY